MSPILLFAISVAVYCVAFWFINRHRGGGYGKYNIRELFKSIGWSWAPRALVLSALLMLMPLTVAFGVVNGIELLNSLYIALTVSVLWFFWGAPGWGSYFDIGTWTLGYKDEPEVTWIDALLLKLYGPDWAPAGENPRKDRKDVIASPTGGIRPEEWRRKRDLTGMCLRMAYGLPLFLGLALLNHFVLDGSLLQSIIIGSIGILTAGIGFIYDFFRHKEHFIEKAENVTGIAWGLLISASFAVILFV